MIEKIWSLVAIHYWLQNNDITSLRRLSEKLAFSDLDLYKVWSSIHLSHLYFLISSYNILIEFDIHHFIIPIIVLAIMTCFFSSTDSHGFGQKTHTSPLFSLFHVAMVVIICSMLVVAIMNLALRWNNKELATEKCKVGFELTSQRKATGLQISILLIHL